MFLGEHGSFFYASSQQKHRCLFSNLMQGIDAGCSTLYISSGENADAVRAELGKFILKNDDLKQIQIVTSHQWYTPDGEFHASRVVDQYRSLIDEALDNGFAGLYVSADVSDTFDYLSKKDMLEEWIAYEHSLGTTFKFPMEAICAYEAEQVKSNWRLLFQLIKGHKNTISLRSEKRIINEQAIRNSVYRQLKEILGSTATTTVFDYLEDCRYTTNDSQPIETFWTVLEAILREGEASIKQNVLKDIYEKITL